MGKPLKVLVIFCVSILALWILARATNMLQYFSAPTTANYPTIKQREQFFASNLAKPKRFDFICYRTQMADRPEMGKFIAMHRLCGMPGDKVELRQGILYVNGQNVDAGLSLAHSYLLSQEEYNRLEKDTVRDNDFVRSLPNDSVITYVSDREQDEKKLTAVKQVLTKDYLDKEIQKIYGENWNSDNLGPITVPANKYFVLGDNRGNSYDSRYQGFIDKSQFVCTVLGKQGK